jgi:hypothetical protein
MIRVGPQSGCSVVGDATLIGPLPFVVQLERAARFKRGDSPPEKVANLETLLMQSALDGDRTVALLTDPKRPIGRGSFCY